MANEKIFHATSEEQSLMIPRDDSLNSFAPRWQFSDYKEPLLKRIFKSIVHLFAVLGLIVGTVWMLQFSNVLDYHKGLRAYTGTASRVPYSPLQRLSAYNKIVTFEDGFESDISIYQGPPTPERDAAWESLYNFGLLKIPRSSASHLVNKTVPVPGDTSNYVISVDVFHQLHCLNMVRKHLWSLELGKEIQNSKHNYLWHLKHVDHCINDLRQSIMCAADIAPVIWAWSESRGRSHPMYPKEHTCRDFNAIRDWAMEHRLDNFDATVLAVDEQADFEPALI